MKLKFENLYIDRRVENFDLVDKIKSKIDFNNLHLVDGENHPGNGLLLTLNKGAWVKPCPGQKGSVCCGYYVVEWGLGCPFGCEYCIIQNYTRAGDITLFLNWDDCKKEILRLRESVKGPIRLGTGQYGDPMAIEEAFPLNKEIIDWTAGFKDFTLEIKTKSDYIKPIIEADESRHVTMAFSLNPQSLIDRLEKGAASLQARLEAAKLTAEKSGCALAFHFDPILPLGNWQDEYLEVFDEMKRKLNNYRINWISIGTFRFPKGFEERVETCHPGSKVLDEEFYPSADGKYRYFRPFREEIYRFAFKNLQKLFPETAIYICMDIPEIWERLTGAKFTGKDLKKLLDNRIQK